MNRKILNIMVLFYMMIGYCFNTYAYDNVTTHKKVTEKAVDNSELRNHLKQTFGYAAGYEENIHGKRIIDWLLEGSYAEDISMCRASNHLHNPLLSWNQSYMTDQPGWVDAACSDWKPWFSNITWATAFLAPPPDGAKTIFGLYKTYDWDTARQEYYRALTNTDKFYRDTAFADTFVTLGHVIHLLQDMSVPAHTRNDFESHLFKNNQGIANLYGIFDRYQPFEKYVEINPWLVAVANPAGNFPSFTNTRLTDFWDTTAAENNDYPLTGTSIGLAEFSNANYFSDYTIPSNNPTTEHVFTRPSINNAEYQICTDYQHNSLDKRKYVSRNSKGACPTLSTERKADHFATASLFNTESVITNSNISNLRLWLDNNVHNTYAKELIPRAVGYSAGLLDYFFRGTLDISAPDQYIYAVADGSSVPQVFTHIKAKLMNTTPDEQIQSGIIQAVAKYKVIPNYSPDLAAYPPNGDLMKTIEYSYKVSAPLTLTTEEIVLLNAQPAEFTFDFTGNEIPAGITDLVLQVIFKGTLGNETDNAVAVGMKDLKEPTHHTFWNLTDMFSLDGHLYTAEQIRDNPELLSLINGAYIDPHKITCEFTYMPESPPAEPIYAAARVTDLPDGRYIRVIVLADDEPTYPYVRMAWHVELPDRAPEDGDNDYYFETVINQDYGGTWYAPTEASIFRTVRQHFGAGVLRCEPLTEDPATGNRYCAYPEEEAIIPSDLTPYPVEILH